MLRLEGHGQSWQNSQPWRARPSVLARAVAPKKFLKKPINKGKQSRRQLQQQKDRLTLGDAQETRWGRPPDGGGRPGTSLGLAAERRSPRDNAWDPGDAAEDDLTGDDDEDGAEWDAERGLLAGLPQEEMSSGVQDWQETFLLPARVRRDQTDARRRQLFGRGWRQLDVRLYLLRRAAQREAFAALLAEAGPQLATARALLTATSQPSNRPVQSNAPPRPQYEAGGARRYGVLASGVGVAATAAPVPLAPIPRPRLPRQRGDGPLDDSLPRPQTYFKLPAAWRRRVLAERVVALRAALPSVTPLLAARLYCAAPVMLCLTTQAVAGQVRALARALSVGANTAVTKMIAQPTLGLTSANQLLLKAASLSRHPFAAPAGATREVLTALTSHSPLLVARLPFLQQRAEQLAWAVPCGQWQATRMLLRCPALVDMRWADLRRRMMEVTRLLANAPGQEAAVAGRASAINGSGSGLGRIPAAPWLGLLQQQATTAFGPQPQRPADASAVALSEVLSQPVLLTVPPAELAQLLQLLQRRAGLTQLQALGVLREAPVLLERPASQLGSTLDALVSLASRYGTLDHPWTAARLLGDVAVQASALLCATPGQVREAAAALQAVVDVHSRGCGAVWEVALRHTRQQVPTDPAIVPGRGREQGSQQGAHALPGPGRGREQGPQQGGQVLPGPGHLVVDACLHHVPWLLQHTLEEHTQLLQLQTSAAARRTSRAAASSGRLVLGSGLRLVQSTAAGPASRGKPPGAAGPAVDRRVLLLPRLPCGALLPDASWLQPHPAAAALLHELLGPTAVPASREGGGIEMQERVSGAAPGQQPPQLPVRQHQQQWQLQQQQLQQHQQPAGAARLAAGEVSVPPSGPATWAQAVTPRQQLMQDAARAAVQPALQALQAYWGLRTAGAAWALFRVAPSVMQPPEGLRGAMAGAGRVAGRGGVSRQALEGLAAELRAAEGAMMQGRQQQAGTAPERLLPGTGRLQSRPVGPLGPPGPGSSGAQEAGRVWTHETNQPWGDASPYPALDNQGQQPAPAAPAVPSSPHSLPVTGRVASGWVAPAATGRPDGNVGPGPDGRRPRPAAPGPAHAPLPAGPATPGRGKATPPGTNQAPEADGTRLESGPATAPPPSAPPRPPPRARRRDGPSTAGVGQQADQGKEGNGGQAGQTGVALSTAVGSASPVKAPAPTGQATARPAQAPLPGPVQAPPGLATVKTDPRPGQVADIREPQGPAAPPAPGSDDAPPPPQGRRGRGYVTRRPTAT